MSFLAFIFTVLFLCAFWKIKKSKGLCTLSSFDLQETLALRGILAICVWLCHLCPYLVKDAPILTDFCLWGPPSVACFFLLSGYGLASSFENKGRGYLSKFFKKRLMRLICPWLIMIVVYQAWCISNGKFSIKNMLIEPSPMAWFIYALMIWYVIFYLSFSCSNLNRRLCVLWVLTIVYLVITIYLGMGYYWMSILPMPIVMSLVPVEKQIKNLINKHPYRSLCVMSFVTITVLVYASLGQMGYPLPIWGPPVYGILPFSVVFLTYILGGSHNRFLTYIGKNSYEFYIVHGFIVMLFHKDGLFGLQGVSNVFLTMSFNLLFVIAAAKVMNVIVSFVCSSKKN